MQYIKNEERYIKNYKRIETKRKKEKKHHQSILQSTLSLIISPFIILIMEPFFSPYHSILIWFMLFLIFASVLFWKLYKSAREIPTLKENLFYHTFYIIVNLKELKKDMINVEYIKKISRSLDEISNSIYRYGIVDDTGFNREKLKLMDSSLKMFDENIPKYKKSLEEHRKNKIDDRISLFENALTYLDEEMFGELDELMRKDYKEPKKKDLMNATQKYYPFLSNSIAFIITLFFCFAVIFIFNPSMPTNLSAILTIVVSVTFLIQCINKALVFGPVKKIVISAYIQINQLFHIINNSK